MKRFFYLSAAVLLVATLSSCSNSITVSFDRWSSSAEEIRTAPYTHQITNPIACQNFLPIVEQSILKMDDIANKRAVIEDLLPALQKVGDRAVEIQKYPTYSQEIRDLVTLIDDAGKTALELRVALLEGRDVRDLFDTYSIYYIEIDVNCTYFPN
jgi:hypothetical protein